jgi:L-ascorbate 6-phosphate lactonase
MESLANTISKIHVEPNSVAIWWLAQAGFVFKTPTGKVIYTDPYLTDYVQRVLPEYGQGFKRIMPKLIEADEVDADAIVSTHSHQDHLDMDALPILKRNPRIHFLGSPDCKDGYDQAGVPADRYTIIHEGETIDLGDYSITGVYADHGELAPDAMGVLFNFGGIKIWQVGDTAYRPEKWQDLFAQNIDIILPPINGAFGNLNGTEAAKLAAAVHAKVAIPCHFWMFAAHYGSPAEFLDACKEFAPDVRPLLLTQGEMFIYKKSGD